MVTSLHMWLSCTIVLADQVKEVAWRRMQGGVTRKKPEWRVKFKAYLLAIEDPNVPGHDISSGTYQIQRVSPSLQGRESSHIHRLRSVDRT